METTTSVYNVRESLLYSTTRQLWNNCSAQISVFASKRAIYTPEFIAERLAEIDAAELLPNDVQRTAVHEMIRLTMVDQRTVCCDDYQMLKLYINAAWKDSGSKEAYVEAGGNLYPECGNWDILKSMLKLGSEFIANHRTRLLASQNMPGTFEEQYNANMDLMNSLCSQYINARQQAANGAVAKIEANNNIYQQCVSMGMEGQQYFKNSPIRSQFSFEAVSSMISPPGASTAVITVLSADNDRPMIAEVINTVTERQVTTEESTGRCEMGNLPAEPTRFIIKADGCHDQELELTLKTGTTTRATVKMVKLFTGAGSSEKSATEMVVVQNEPAAFN